MSCRPAKAATVAATQVLALPEVAAAQEQIVEVASTPAKMWAIFSPSSADGRPEGGHSYIQSNSYLFITNLLESNKYRFIAAIVSFYYK